MSDERVVGVVRSSGAYRAADAVLQTVESGWSGARARNILGVASANGTRFWSVVTLVASATALLLAPLGADPRPLAWIVPALAGALSIVILVSAPR
jgi:hypothetical protein